MTVHSPRGRKRETSKTKKTLQPYCPKYKVTVPGVIWSHREMLNCAPLSLEGKMGTRSSRKPCCLRWQNRTTMALAPTTGPQQIPVEGSGTKYGATRGKLQLSAKVMCGNLPQESRPREVVHAVVQVCPEMPGLRSPQGLWPVANLSLVPPPFSPWPDPIQRPCCQGLPF